MTLRQLHERIGQIMAENDARYASEKRNDLPVAIELGTFGPLRQNGRRSWKTRFIPVQAASSAMTGLTDNSRWMTIKAVENDQV